MPKVLNRKLLHSKLHLPNVPDYSDEEEDEGCEDELEDEDGSSAGGSGRVVQTVSAKEPRMDAVPLKSALKKPGGPVVITRQQNGRKSSASTPPQEKNQNSR